MTRQYQIRRGTEGERDISMCNREVDSIIGHSCFIVAVEIRSHSENRVCGTNWHNDGTSLQVHMQALSLCYFFADLQSQFPLVQKNRSASHLVPAKEPTHPYGNGWLVLSMTAQWGPDLGGGGTGVKDTLGTEITD